MSLTGLFVVIGTITILVIISLLIRLFNKSKSVLGWFRFLLQQIGVALKSLLFFCLGLFIICILSGVAWLIIYQPLRWGEKNLTLIWHYILITLSFVYFISLIVLTGKKKFYIESGFLFNEEERDDKRGKTPHNIGKKPVGNGRNLNSFISKQLALLYPFIIIVALVMVGITCFASFTGALNNNGSVAFVPVIEANQTERLFDFYTWHFCNLIPQIKVVETLNWKAPYEYSDSGVGWLVLFFKSLMAYLVIARFYEWNKWRKESYEKKALDHTKTMN